MHPPFPTAMNRSILPLLSALVTITTASGAGVSVGSGGNLGLVVPDNDPSGLVHVQTVSGLTAPVQSVAILLDVIGGWNGDLYAYVEFNGVISVLLNRPGRAAGNDIGAGTSGFVAVFDDGAALDAHLGFAGPAGQPVTGIFQPDARAADPSEVLDSSPRSLFLSGFSGMDGNGDWTLFVADLESGDTSVVNGWQIDIIQVPEPATALLPALAGLLALRRRRADGRCPQPDHRAGLTSHS
jgi:hypothetical protein